MISKRFKKYKNFTGFAVMAGLSAVTHGSSNIAVSILNSIAGNLASSFIEKADYQKIVKLIHETHPSDLNHDLHKTIIKAIDWSIQNIEILYRPHADTKERKQELKAYTKSLRNEIEVLNDSLTLNAQDLYGLIEYQSTEKDVLDSFDFDLASFPDINPEVSYKVFFKEKFYDNLKLCFGELLKSPDNRSAYLAYQREVYKSIENGIQQIKNDRAVQTEASDLDVIQKSISSTSMKRIDPLFEDIFISNFKRVDEKLELLIASNNKLEKELSSVKGLVKGINRDVKESWIQKNKVVIFSALSVLFLAMISLAYLYASSPFQSSITLHPSDHLELENDYPALSNDSKLRIYWPNGMVDKEITDLNEVSLVNIEHSLKNGNYKIELSDPYWRFEKDSFYLKDGPIALSVVPNAKLSIVEGKVLSRDGEKLISGVRISVNGSMELTNNNGEFRIEIPVNKRKPKYIIRVEKDGYSSGEWEYFPGSIIEIRLPEL